MFTVKQILNDGCERIFRAGEVAYYPKGIGACVSACISFDVPPLPGQQHVQQVLDDGDFFVMNETGRTVTRYTINKAKSDPSTAPKSILSSSSQAANNDLKFY